MERRLNRNRASYSIMHSTFQARSQAAKKIHIIDGKLATGVLIIRRGAVVGNGKTAIERHG